MSSARIEIPTADGVADAHVFHPPGEGPWPAVLFYQDGLGVREALLAMGERLASNGYYVLLPNMFYRAGHYDPFDPATVFNGGPERERVMALVRSVTPAAAMRDTGVFLDYLGKQKGVRGTAIGAVGYCMGGGLSLLAAGTFPDRVAAAAAIHGARLATEQPDSPHLLAPKIRAKIYLGVAEIDRNFTLEEKGRLTSALDAAGVRYSLEVYPGVAHGFAVTDVPVYDRAAAERHWEKVVSLFRETLS